MKIQLTIPNQQKIEGIREIAVKNGNIDFEDISDNECEYILADKILNHFDYKNITDCLVSLRKKLRIGGKIVIGGIDLRMFTTNVINNLMSTEDASEVVANCKSMSDVTQIANIISQLDLKVITTQINGIYYEITAER
jgi:predicted SAM-dependent methyltransferase